MDGGLAEDRRQCSSRFTGAGFAQIHHNLGYQSARRARCPTPRLINDYFDNAVFNNC